MSQQNATPAGPFLAWLEQTNSAQPAEVPCGTCNACCRASYFIHVSKTDIGAQRVIPTVLLFPAPGRTHQSQLMGFDETGSCPMLVNTHCSIYVDRPMTCKDYDCRIFAATGIKAGAVEKAGVNERIENWQFDYPTQADHTAQAAVLAAMTFLTEQQALFAQVKLPTNPSERALLALAHYKLFIATPSAADQKYIAHQISLSLQATNNPR